MTRHSRLKTSDLQARLKALDLPGGTFTPEQVVEFVDLMQVYEGAMYEISTKLEILDDEFQVRFSHDPIHHMERMLKLSELDHRQTGAQGSADRRQFD